MFRLLKQIYYLGIYIYKDNLQPIPHQSTSGFFWRNKNFNVEILILINYGWHQNFRRQDSDSDKVYVASKNSTSRFVVLILELNDSRAWNQKNLSQDSNHDYI
jgi:hypothetical protein